MANIETLKAEINRAIKKELKRNGASPHCYVTTQLNYSDNVLQEAEQYFVDKNFDVTREDNSFYIQFPPWAGV